jgi:hypothetical protein
MLCRPLFKQNRISALTTFASYSRQCKAIGYLLMIEPQTVAPKIRDGQSIGLRKENAHVGQDVAITADAQGWPVAKFSYCYRF